MMQAEACDSILYGSLNSSYRARADDGVGALAWPVRTIVRTPSASRKFSHATPSIFCAPLAVESATLCCECGLNW